MFFYKRIILSILRRPIKSGLLLVLIFILGAFSGTSYLISNFVKEIELNMKKSIDTYAVIKYKDYDKYLTELNENEYKNSQSNLFKIYEVLSSNDYVSMNNINFATECSHIGTFKSNLSLLDGNSFYDYLDNTVPLLGIDNNTSIFQNLYTIVDGTTNINEEVENNEFAVVVNKDYKYDDGKEVRIGDKIYIDYRNYEVDFNDEDIIYSTNNSIRYELTVIAKYDITNTNKELYDLMYSQTKPLIISNSLLTKISNESEKSDINKNLIHDYTNFIYTNIIFKLDSVDSLNFFQNQYMDLAKDMPYFEMITTADGYLEIKGVLDNLNLISNTILIITLLSSVLIGMLVIYLYIKDRKFETGLLLALGEKANIIMAQVVCEIGIITLLGLSCSVFTSNVIGKIIAEKIVANQVQLFEETYSEELENNYELNITKEYLIVMYSLGIMIISISCVLPVNNLLKSNPKDTLI